MTAVGLTVVVDSASDSMTFVNAGVWSFTVVDATGTALGGSSALPATSAALAAFQIVGTTLQFAGDVDVSGGGGSAKPSFTATAVPEPSAFLFGGGVCGLCALAGPPDTEAHDDGLRRAISTATALAHPTRRVESGRAT